MVLNISVVLGTRPEFVKMATTVRSLSRDASCRCDVIFTNQHPDLGPIAANSLGVQISHELTALPQGRTMTQILGHMVHELATVVPEDTDLMVVQGDTLSALAGGLVAELRLIPLVHVEAGVRSGAKDDPFPEEVSRRLISQVAELHICFNESSIANLVAEGHPRDSMRFVRHPLQDHVSRVRREASSQEVTDGVLVTLHRRERRRERLVALVEILRQVHATNPNVHSRFVWHPGLAAPGVGWRETLGSLGCEIVDPLDPLEFLSVLASARCVLTDSAGVAEEAQLLAIPLAVFRAAPESRLDVPPIAPVFSSEDPSALARFLSAHVSEPGPERSLSAAESTGAGDEIGKEILGVVKHS